MDRTEMLRSIINGELDEHLDLIADVIRRRRDLVAQQNAGMMQAGDTVRFRFGIRPKYLGGRTATVVAVEGSKIIVSCPYDSRYGRYSGSSAVRCPNTMLELVETPVTA